MLKNIIHFIKYHNLFTLAVVVVTVGGSSAFAASPKLRDAAEDALVGKTETIVSVDNGALLSADFDAFNPELVITAVSEDTDAYYVSYAFNTFAVSDGAWRSAKKDGELVVSKETLGGVDLREYVQKQLAEVARAEAAYLKEVKEKEIEKGKMKKTVAVVYTGLLGLVVDPKEKEVEINRVAVSTPSSSSESSSEASSISSSEASSSSSGEIISSSSSSETSSSSSSAASSSSAEAISSSSEASSSSAEASSASSSSESASSVSSDSSSSSVEVSSSSSEASSSSSSAEASSSSPEASADSSSSTSQ